MSNNFTDREARSSTTQKRGGRIRRILLSLLALFVVLVLVIQLVPYGRAHANPPVVAEPQWDSVQTQELFDRACADCHSNGTEWPWYTNVAPVSWLVQRDVEQGRAEFNISEWNHAENEGDEAAETVQSGEMPPWFYVLPHPEANLSATEEQMLVDGLLDTFGGESERNGIELEHEETEYDEDESD